MAEKRNPSTRAWLRRPRVSRLAPLPPTQPGRVGGGQRESRRSRQGEAAEIVLLSSAPLGTLRSEIVGWVAAVLSALAPAARSVGVKLCGDRAMRTLNREHRGKDQTTDVLSFAGGETPEGYHLGDIVISLPQAERQAEAAGHSLERELRVLLLHGVLHCLGYDHETDGGEMERLERRLRRRWLDGC